MEQDTRENGASTITSNTAAGGFGEDVRTVLTLCLVYTPDLRRIGEQVVPGKRSLPLNRSSSVFSGGPLTDPEISRLHARIVGKGSKGFLVSDEGSKNGTFVNGQPVSKEGSFLEAGDVLRVGDSLLMALEKEFPEPTDADLTGIGGMSDGIRKLRHSVSRYASINAPVLILGETGTGKELVAKSLAQVGRPEGSFLPFNVGTLSPTMVDSTLFGHVRGAFTDARDSRPGLFRAADKGTLFLDEIGELSSDTQVRLLRVLEEGKVVPLGATKSVSVDVRVVAATNRDLVQEVSEKRFRADLYARLAHLTLKVPALRDRQEDISRLALLFSGGRPFQTSLMELFLAHSWPFNVRELKAAVEQAQADSSGKGPVALTRTVSERLEEHERAFRKEQTDDRLDHDVLESTLQKHHGNVSRVARELGKDRAQVYRTAKRLGLDPEQFRS